MNNNLYNKLKSIKYDLDKAQSINPLEDGLDIKLKRAESKYKQNIINNCNYILSKNNCKVMMIISNYMSNKENNNGEETKYTTI